MTPRDRLDGGPRSRRPRWRPRPSADRVDDALAALRAGVRRAEVEADFGIEATRRAALAQQLRAGRLPSRVPEAHFVDQLEGRLRIAHARARTGAGRARQPGIAALRRSMAAAGIAAALVAGVVFAPADGGGTVQASAAPIAAAARTPDDGAGPTPPARMASAHAAADVVAALAQRPDANATRPPIGAHR